MEDDDLQSTSGWTFKSIVQPFVFEPYLLWKNISGLQLNEGNIQIAVKTLSHIWIKNTLETAWEISKLAFHTGHCDATTMNQTLGDTMASPRHPNLSPFINLLFNNFENNSACGTHFFRMSSVWEKVFRVCCKNFSVHL